MESLQVYQLFQCLANITSSDIPAVPRLIEKRPPIDVLRQKDYQVCITPGCVKAAAFLSETANLTADPCEDFYQFTCGNWLANNDIPEDDSSNSVFKQIFDTTEIKIRRVLENDEPAKDESNAETVAKIIYRHCMNEEAHEKTKSKPLWDYLSELGGLPMVTQGWDLKSPKVPDLPNLEAILKNDFGAGFFSLFVEIDQKNSSRRILQLYETGLGLGVRDYYLNKTQFENYQKGYIDFITSIVTLLADDNQAVLPSDWEQQIQEFFEFETKVAEIKETPVEARNATAHYNFMTFGEVRQQYSWVDWDTILKYVVPKDVWQTITDKSPVNLNNPKYMEEIEELVSKTNKRTLYNYLILAAVFGSTDLLDERYYDIQDKFGRLLSGRQVKVARWKRCKRAATGVLGRAVGALFVKRYFNEREKDEAVQMVDLLQQVFHEALDELSWMDDETREAAKTKASRLVKNIGFSDVEFNATNMDNYYKELSYNDSKLPFYASLELQHWANSFHFRKLLEPVNKTEFTVGASVVNAYYNPLKNSIIFPAGILQPPVFSGDFPKAINFGAMGAVIGHEITHGFDDQGKEFDVDGNLRVWWTPESNKRFTEKKTCMVNQYSDYFVEEVGLNVNGELTQGENIADNGGIKIAYKAYKKFKEINGEQPRLPGELQRLTDEQVFFMGFSLFWCSKRKKESQISQILADPHSPPDVRVKGVYSNSNKFAEAFNCPVGSVYNPVPSDRTKCEVW